MTKTKFLSAMVVLLVLLNITVLVIFMGGKQGGPRHHRHEGPKFLIIEKLHFDEEQVSTYEKLIERHRRQIGEQEALIMEAKNRLYTLLKGDDLSLRDALIGKIGAAQERIEQIHFEHFRDIRELCHEDQLPYFDDLSEELAHLFHKGPPPHPHHR